MASVAAIQNDQKDVKLEEVRLRFQSQFSKYGHLWKSMAPSPLSKQEEDKQEERVETTPFPPPTREPFFSLLPAIENKQTVSFRVNNCNNGQDGMCVDGDNCINCAPPIYEEVDYQDDEEDQNQILMKRTNQNSNNTLSSEESDESDDDYECDFNLSRVCDDDDDDDGEEEEEEHDDDDNLQDQDGNIAHIKHETKIMPKNEMNFKEDLQYRTPASPTSSFSSEHSEDSSEEDGSSFECDFNLSRICDQDQDDNNNDGIDHSNPVNDNGAMNHEGVMAATEEEESPYYDNEFNKQQTATPSSTRFIKRETTKHSPTTVSVEGNYRNATNNNNNSDDDDSTQSGNDSRDKQDGQSNSLIDNTDDEDEDSVSSGNTILAARRTPHKATTKDDFLEESSLVSGSTIVNDRKNPHRKEIHDKKLSDGDMMDHILDLKTLSISNSTTTPAKGHGHVKLGSSCPLSVEDEDDFLPEASPMLLIPSSTPPVVRFDKNENDHESKGGSISSSENEWDGQSESSESQASQGPPEAEFSVIILSDDEEEEEEEEDSGDEDFVDDEISSSDSDRSNESSEVEEEEEPNENDFGRVNRKSTPTNKRQKELPPSISKKATALSSDVRTHNTLKVPRKNKEMSKASFGRAREDLTSTTFAEFNDIAFDKKLKDVKVTWSSHLRTTAGLTRLKKITKLDSPPLRTASIELSTKIIDEHHRLRSTLLHEMCHAAAWLLDGVAKPPHGAVFKKWAKHSMKKIRDVVVTTTHSYEISYKYAWACTAPKCGVVIKRHSRSIDPTKQCCGRCKGKLVEIEVPDSSVKNAQHTPRKKKPLSGFNLFVQQQSKPVRAKLQAELGPKVTQSQVMKECARIWREQKQGN